MSSFGCSPFSWIEHVFIVKKMGWAGFVSGLMVDSLKVIDCVAKLIHLEHHRPTLECHLENFIPIRRMIYETLNLVRCI